MSKRYIVVRDAFHTYTLDIKKVKPKPQKKPTITWEAFLVKSASK